MTKPDIVSENTHKSVSQKARGIRVERGVIHEIFHFLFSKVEDSTSINRMSLSIHILKENQLMPKEQTV